MKKKTDFKTKFNAVVLAFMLIALGSVVVYAVTRTITDSNDPIDTYIRNSKGNMWTPTEANFQDAIWDLNSTDGGTIWLPSCNISVDDGIHTIDNLVVTGMGNTTILYLTAGHYSRMGIITVTNTNVIIEKILFDSNNGSQTYGDYISGVDLYTGSHYCIIRNCCFMRNSFAGVHTKQSDVSHNTVENNYVFGRENNGYGGGIVMRGSYNIVRNNFIKDTYATGITMEGEGYSHDNIIDGNIISGYISVCIYTETARTRNNTICNNIIYDQTGYIAGYTNCAILTSGYTIVSNNRISNCNYRGIYCKPDNYTGNPVGCNIVVTGNIIIASPSMVYQAIIVDKDQNGNSLDCAIVSNNVVRGVSGSACIELKCKHGVVTGNDVSESSTDGIECDDAVMLSVVINNNHLFNVSGNGINLGGIEDGTICGNSLYKTTVANTGIYLSSCQNMTVIGNKVKGYQYGIREYSVSDYNVFVGNNCEGCTTGTDVLAGGHSINSANLPTAS